MAKKLFRYGALKVSVEDVGAGIAPWDDRRAESRMEYNVTVTGPAGSRYKSKAWGSVSDFREGKVNHRGMARLVIGDLASAISDPDEWFNIVIGEAEGREAYERGKEAERILEAARKIGHDAISRAEGIAREEEERGVGPKEWTPED